MQLNNDVDANLSQGLQDRKGRKPYRTATAQKASAKARQNKSDHAYAILAAATAAQPARSLAARGNAKA